MFHPQIIPDRAAEHVGHRAEGLERSHVGPHLETPESSVRVVRQIMVETDVDLRAGHGGQHRLVADSPRSLVRWTETQ
jgi:hypothetical protein